MRDWIRPDTWPLPLRWFVAMFVVPVMPLAAVALVGGFLFLLGIYPLLLLVVPLGFATLYFVPVAWLFFVPTYFAIDRWWQHTKKVYVRAALAATVLATVVIAIIIRATDGPYESGLPYLAFGFLVALPYAMVMGKVMWCVLWKGREAAPN